MSWDAVLGHELPKRMFQAHLASGQVPGAYLLAGPEGIGKRTLALELAKAMACTGGDATPCDRCSVCLQVSKGAHPDVHVLSPGGASAQIKIDDVRHLIGRLMLRPFNAANQVAILDGAERLTEEAANSLLKILEEPGARARFILITAQVAHCLPTVRSRCQLIRCAPLPHALVARLLVERHGSTPARAAQVAREAGGSVSAALALLQRWDARQALRGRFAQEPRAWLASPLPETREEVAALVDGMLVWLRDVAAVASGSTMTAHPEHADVLRRQAAGVDVDRCVAAAMELVALRQSLEQFVSPRLVANLAREQWLSLTDVKREAYLVKTTDNIMTKTAEKIRSFRDLEV